MFAHLRGRWRLVSVITRDQVDGYDDNNGHGYTAADQLVYDRWLVQQAHQRGLAIGLKNDPRHTFELLSEFDFAVNEEVSIHACMHEVLPLLREFFQIPKLL